ncbi:MAG TPA: WecB/TagA/CpsF family glycosyltransferase [Sedimentisphaerales bacterium]|nr:WecB/TagA/CpsF family glycosyltransferase [Sedimentisphaerales bacterium]HRV48933.1 WecB/TagA/CpsF family glycosyltransferase [Sedimentisphaerales bacterium]
MNPADGMETVEVMGVPVTCFRSYRHAVECILARIEANEKTFCLAVGPEKICFAKADKSLLHLIRQADMHCCDGIGAALAVRLLCGRAIPRITGVQLFHELLVAAEAEALRVFLLGATPRSSELAYCRLQQRHPHLQLVGRHDGYFDEDDPVIEQVNAAHPDMLFVAMGSPKQERWIARHRDALGVPFCMGIGGTLDVVSGQAKWAPRFVRRTGTEFLYRLLMEPRRWRRYGIVPEFACRVLLEMALPRRSQDEPLS